MAGDPTLEVMINGHISGDSSASSPPTSAAPTTDPTLEAMISAHTTSPRVVGPGQGAFGGNATIDPVSGAEIPRDMRPANRPAPPQPYTALSIFPAPAPGAIGRIGQAAAEGFEGGQVLPSSNLWAPVVNPVTGLAGAAFRGGQQFVAEALPGGLGRDIAAIPEAFPTGPLNTLHPELVQPRPPPFKPTPRFVPEYYGEGTPQNPLGSQTLLQQVTGAIQRADQDRSAAPPGAGPAPPPAAPPPAFVPPGASAYPPGTPRAVEAGPRRGDVLAYGTPTEEGPPPAPPAAQPTPASPPSTAIPSEPPPNPATYAGAKQIASALYDTADKAGGTLTPQFTGDWLDSLSATERQTPWGKTAAGESEASKLARDFQQHRGEPMTLQGAQEVDEAFGDRIDAHYDKINGLDKEGKKLLDLQSAFRDRIENAGPGDITGGTEGFNALGDARTAWSQAMKLGDIERIQRRAAMTDNPSTSIKTQARNLLESSRSRGYSPEERAALQDATERGVLGGALHVFGSRLVPLAVGAVGLGSHGLLAGVGEALGAHAATTGMRNWSTVLQQRRLAEVSAAIGRAVPPNPLGPQP